MNLKRRVAIGLFYGLFAFFIGNIVLINSVGWENAASNSAHMENETFYYCRLFPVYIFLIGLLVGEAYHLLPAQIAITNWLWRGIVIALIGPLLLAVSFYVHSEGFHGSYSSDRSENLSSLSLLLYDILLPLFYVGWLEIILGALLGLLLGLIRKNSYSKSVGGKT